MKTIYIHIGLHKTGSTSIQKYLNNNSDNFKCYIPKKGRIDIKNTINHGNIAWEILGDSRFNQKQGCLKDLLKEIENKKKIFLSSEDFELVLSNLELKMFFENCLKDFKIYYIAFIRNTEDHLASLIHELTTHMHQNKKLILYRFPKYIYQYLTKGYIINNLYETKVKSYFFINHKVLIRNFKKNSRGKFLFFEYDKKNILEEFDKLNFLIEKNKNNLNIYKNTKKGKIKFIIQKLIKKKIIYIKKDRNLKLINIINKSLNNF